VGSAQPRDLPDGGVLLVTLTKMQDAIERFVTYYGALRAKVMPRLLGTADGKEAA